MLKLYIKPTCPFCLRVIKANEEIKAPLELLDITSDAKILEDLIVKSGQRQVPFLEDEERGVSMPESSDIIDYLAKYYGDGTTPKTTAEGDICPI